MSDALLRFFNSLKLTLALIALTGLLAALGTFLPQGPDNYPQVIEKYGQQAFERLQALGLLDVYQSWWFLLVLTLFALNLIACTIVRLPKVWRARDRPGGSAEEGLSELHVPRTSFESVLEVPLPAPAALDRVRRLLQAEFGSAREGESMGRRVLWAEKNLPALWGAYIVHAGLLLLLLAGSLRILFGFSRELILQEGEAAFLPLRQGHSLTTKIRLDRFEVDYYKGTALPSLFRSDVTVLRDDRVERVASIKVNEPLDVGEALLYQASWGYHGLRSAELEIRLPGFAETFAVESAPYRQRFALLDSGWEAEITDFYPEADMAAPGRIVQTGSQLNNPALRLKFFHKGKERAHFWVMMAYPSIQMSKVPGLLARAKTVDPIPFTVLQVAHDPGVPLALVGAGLVLLGVFCSFYLFYRRVWVAVESTESGCRLWLTGLCRRNPLSFRRDFEKLENRLKRELA